eukprot:PLAT7505.1.p1 GENE.PLAT7505.1~~PLAT7505.1.p1  ORF type:complete len:364 (+),score=109.06 PLAT7505.1:147-1238(+)
MGQSSSRKPAKAKKYETEDVPVESKEEELPAICISELRPSEVLKLVMKAARVGDLPKLKQLAASGASVVGAERSGYTALHAAASSGHVDCIEWLLSMGASVHARERTETTPLLFAAYCGNLEAVELLLKAGAPVTDVDVCKCTALHGAASAGRLDVCRRLLEEDCSAEWLRDDGNSALLRAVAAGQSEAASLLLQAGAVLPDEEHALLLLHYPNARRTLPLLLRAGLSASIRMKLLQTSAEEANVGILSVMLADLWRPKEDGEAAAAEHEPPLVVTHAAMRRTVRGYGKEAAKCVHVALSFAHSSLPLPYVFDALCEARNEDVRAELRWWLCRPLLLGAADDSSPLSQLPVELLRLIASWLVC